jgi:hypothetical protein
MNSLDDLTGLYDSLVTQAKALPELDYAGGLSTAATAPDGRLWNTGLSLSRSEIVGELTEIQLLVSRVASLGLLPSQRLMVSYQLNHAFNQIRDALNNLSQPGVAWGYINQIHSIKTQLEAAGVTTLAFDRDHIPGNLKVLQRAVVEAERVLSAKTDLNEASKVVEEAKSRAQAAAQDGAAVFGAIEQLRIDAKLSAESVSNERANIQQLRESAELGASESTDAARVAKQNQVTTLEAIKGARVAFFHQASDVHLGG